MTAPARTAPATASTGPRIRTAKAACLLAALVLLLVPLLGACSATPRRRAASRAVKEMVEDLRSKRTDLDEAEAGRKDPLRVMLYPSDGIGTDVAWALNKHTDGLRIVASGQEAEQQLQVLMASTGDEFDASDHNSGFEQLGKRFSAELLIQPVQRELDDGEVEVVVRASKLKTGLLEGQGIGSSYGTAERAKSWGVTGAKVLASPFLVILDIGATSVDYAFKDEKKPGFVSTVSRGLLAIVYSPVAIFTSKYPKTRNWFSDNEE